MRELLDFLRSVCARSALPAMQVGPTGRDGQRQGRTAAVLSGWHPDGNPKQAEHSIGRRSRSARIADRGDI